MQFEDYRVGAVVEGALKLERLVALGGGGAVFEAVDLRTRRRVAVKVLRPGNDGCDERRHARFLREARIAMRLTSHHAVRIFDVVTPHEGPAYLVMEFLEGETLADRLRRCGPLPVPDAVDWILQAIEPLAEMHAAGIIHRDVKPSNLFVAVAPDGTQTIKLLDFGIVTPDPATEIDADLTMTDAELGTPLYMAPEQFLNAKYVDARADVWSLGVTLFQLLSGRMPFHGTTVAGLSLRILYDEPEPLEHARPEVPGPLAAIVMRCLEKEPAARIADVRALGSMLEPFAGRPEHRDPESTMPMPVTPSQAMVVEEPETLDASFETPPPHSVPGGIFVKRARWARWGAVALGAAAWLWVLASIGQHAPDPPEATAAPAVDPPTKEATRETRDTIVERAPRPEPIAPRVVAAETHAPTPRAVPRPPPPRATPARHAAPPRASATPPPRSNVVELDPIDDRIW